MSYARTCTAVCAFENEPTFESYTRLHCCAFIPTRAKMADVSDAAAELAAFEQNGAIEVTPELALAEVVHRTFKLEPLCIGVVTRNKNLNVMMYMVNIVNGQLHATEPVRAEWLEFATDESGSTRSKPTYFENIMAFGFYELHGGERPRFKLMAFPSITWYVHFDGKQYLLLVSLGDIKLAAYRTHVNSMQSMDVYGYVMPEQTTRRVVRINRQGAVLFFN